MRRRKRDLTCCWQRRTCLCLKTVHCVASANCSAGSYLLKHLLSRSRGEQSERCLCCRLPAMSRKPSRCANGFQHVPRRMAERVFGCRIYSIDNVSSVGGQFSAFERRETPPHLSSPSGRKPLVLAKTNSWTPISLCSCSLGPIQPYSIAGSSSTIIA